MRRSAQVLLVLMGGGMVTAATIPLWRQQECEPPALQGGACQTGSSGSRSSSGGNTGAAFRSTSTDGSSSTASSGVARGGFGATGTAHASSSGS